MAAYPPLWVTRRTDAADYRAPQHALADRDTALPPAWRGLLRRLSSILRPILDTPKSEAFRPMTYHVWRSDVATFQDQLLRFDFLEDEAIVDRHPRILASSNSS